MKNKDALNPFKELKKIKNLNNKVKQVRKSNEQVKRSTSFNYDEYYKDKKENKKNFNINLNYNNIKNYILKKYDNFFKSIKNFKLQKKSSYILIKINYYSEDEKEYSIFNIDFDCVKFLVIKDVYKNLYIKINKENIYSYYFEDKFLYLRLNDNNKIKIRYLS